VIALLKFSLQLDFEETITIRCKLTFNMKRFVFSNLSQPDSQTGFISTNPTISRQIWLSSQIWFYFSKV